MAQNIPASTWPELDELEDEIVRHPNFLSIHDAIISAVACDTNARCKALVGLAKAFDIPIRDVFNLN